MTDTIQSIIFGFGHRDRCGKDTAARYIIDARSAYLGEHIDIRRYSFAQELKREVNECAMKSGGMFKLFDPGLYIEGFGFMQDNENFLALPEWVQYDPDPPMDDPDCPYGKQRSFLRWYGTDYRRSINANYWVNKVARRIEKEKPEIALITDLRFPNEAQWVLQFGEVIRIDRPELPPLTAESHESEKALVGFPFWSDVIKNDGTLEEFRENVLFSFDMLMSAVPEQRPTLK
jgi:hypothetical protein